MPRVGTCGAKRLQWECLREEKVILPYRVTPGKQIDRRMAVLFASLRLFLANFAVKSLTLLDSFQNLNRKGREEGLQDTQSKLSSKAAWYRMRVVPAVSFH
jgi:hypothetical protein